MYSFAQPSELEEVLVFGRNQDLIGNSQGASEGSVEGADLLLQPLFKTAELLESMPGMVAVQHSGSGKANQYFLRGFNLDHGTDYSVTIDGLPVNLSTHGHGQGYLDVNGLIPETVERIDYRKGPYYAELGDFSMAGASKIKTIDKLDRNFVSLEGGHYGWQRVVGGQTIKSDLANYTWVGEYKHNDGPWEKEEKLNHLSLWGKGSWQTHLGEFSSTISYYNASWDPTEQIPERVLRSQICENVFCSLDPTSKGSTQRLTTTVSHNTDTFDATVWAQQYDWKMNSNPTYDYQINQFDKRNSIGATLNHLLFITPQLEVSVGGNASYDYIRLTGVEHTLARLFQNPISANSAKNLFVGTYLSAEWMPTEKLRVMTGLRGDTTKFEIDALNELSSTGKDSDIQFSPKISVAYLVSANLELYSNFGRGFHTNDARGVINTEDPVPAISPGKGYEWGARFSTGDLKVTTAWWWLKQSSELIFIGDANSVEPKGASKRQGLELTAFWQPRDWLGIDAVYTHSNARYVDNPEGVYVEGAVEETAQIGVSATLKNWDLALRARYLGPYALSADNQHRSQSLLNINLRAAWHHEQFTIYAELANLLDTDRKEITYFYPAFVSGYDNVMNSEEIDCSEVNCRMSRATIPRSIRLGISYRF